MFLLLHLLWWSLNQPVFWSRQFKKAAGLPSFSTIKTRRIRLMYKWYLCCCLFHLVFVMKCFFSNVWAPCPWCSHTQLQLQSVATKACICLCCCSPRLCAFSHSPGCCVTVAYFHHHPRSTGNTLYWQSCMWHAPEWQHTLVGWPPETCS